jgi:hypothetical protein
VSVSPGHHLRDIGGPGPKWTGPEPAELKTGS